MANPTHKSLVITVPKGRPKPDLEAPAVAAFAGTAAAEGDAPEAPPAAPAPVALSPLAQRRAAHAAKKPKPARAETPGERVAVYLEPTLALRMREIAFVRRTTLSAVAGEALAQYLGRLEAAEKRPREAGVKVPEGQGTAGT